MSQKVAYVTGGMGGIGTAICQRLHKEGFKVIAGCGPTRDFTKWLDEQKALGYTFYASVGNVGDWNSTVDAFTKAKAEHGPIDVLVNNAGITRDTLLMRMKDEDWNDVISTNLSSVFRMSQAVLRPMMKARVGRIISISSVAGLRYVGKPQVAYAAGKAALMQLTKTTAVLYASKGIRLNCVVPGLVFTPLVKRLADKYAGGQYEAFVEHRHKQVPAGHMGDAWDVANTVLFLASDESRYITAQSIVVDGGLIAATR